MYLTQSRPLQLVIGNWIPSSFSSFHPPELGNIHQQI